MKRLAIICAMAVMLLGFGAVNAQAQQWNGGYGQGFGRGFEQGYGQRAWYGSPYGYRSAMYRGYGYDRDDMAFRRHQRMERRQFRRHERREWRQFRRHERRERMFYRRGW